VFEAMDTKLYTIDDMQHIEGDYELDEGVLVPMTPPQPPHGFVVARMTMRLGVHVSSLGLGSVFAGDTGCVLHRNPDTLRGVDVAFMSRARLPEQPAPQEGFLEGGPDLAIEVLSPGNRRGEMLRKVGQYINAGSSLVWVIDPRRRRVVVYGGDDDVQILAEGDVLTGGEVLPAFSCPVAWLFSNDPL
jgi:Uma2 family endonuclease